MCTRLTHYDYMTVHHEIGHIYNYLFYKDKPFIFRQSANPAFTEALGDALALSAMTPTHLKKMGLLENISASKG